MKINKMYSSAILTSPLLIFSLLFSGFIGSDVNNYRSIYNSEFNIGVEPIFVILKCIFLYFESSYKNFSTFYALFEVTMLCYISSKIKDSLLFLYLYFSLFYLNFHFNTLRFSLAALLFTVILITSKSKQIKTAYAVAILSHYSFIIALLIRKFSSKSFASLSNFAIIIIFISTVFVWNFNEFLISFFESNFLIAKFFSHFNLYEETKSIYPALLLKNILLYVLYRNGLNGFYFKIYSLFTLLVHLINPGLARISDLILYVSLIDFFMNSSIQKFRNFIIFLAFVLSISALYIPMHDCDLNSIDNWCITDNTTNQTNE